MIFRIFAICFSIVVLTGCATWSHTEATKDGKPVEISTASEQQKNPDDIILSKEDITDKNYSVIAELEVVVNKTTIFHKDPTREMVDRKLQEDAAKLGADAVIQIRYGTVGISIVSWGSLDAKGRAVRFN